MVVNARAEKARVSRRVFCRALFEILDDLRFRIRTGNLQRFGQPVFLRNTRKQFVNRSFADGGQHFLPLDGALREIAH